MEKDIFCKIIDGEIPCAKVYEDNDVLAFLDISQATKGHTLVVPKKHYANILECPKELLAKVMEVAQRVGKSQMETLGAKGINVLSNCNEVAGQSVMHFHVHVVPRYDANDGFNFKVVDNSGKENLADIAKLISSKM